MIKLFLVNRVDFRGTNPIKVFVLKENAKQFCGECNIAWKLVNNSEHPENELPLLLEFDINATICNTRYVIEEILSE